MMKQALAMVLAVLLAGAVAAQKVEVDARSDGKSSSKQVIVISKDGKTYKKVVVDGKVVEESGDPDLAKDLDVDIDVDVGGKAGGKKSKRSRRVVLKNGEKVLDLDLGGIDLPKEVQDVLDRIRQGRFDFDFDVDVKPGGGSKSKSRRVVIVNGEKVIDETKEGPDAFEFDFDLSEHLPGNLKELFEDLGTKGKGRVRLFGPGKHKLFGPDGKELEFDIEIPHVEFDTFEMPDLDELLKGRMKGVEELLKGLDVEIEGAEGLDELMKRFHRRGIGPKKPRGTEKSIEREIESLQERIRELQERLEKLSGDEGEGDGKPVRLRKTDR